VSRLVTTPRRRAVLAGAICTVLALVALLIAATRPTSIREYAIDVPNGEQVAVLKPHDSTCQGPVSAAGPVDRVEIWGGSVIGPNRLRVEVRDATSGAVLSHGTVTTTTMPFSYFAQLTSTVPGGRPVRVCLTSTLNSFSLLGSASVQPGVNMTNVKGTFEYSMNLIGTHQGLLGNLSKGFGRASLFRPDWVGEWTFWVLLALVVGSFGLGVAAVSGAASEDEAGDAGVAGDARGPGPQPPSSASTARQ
jgi:hypothetical protein